MLSGEDRFFGAALGELSGLTYGRASSIINAHHLSGFRALCRKAGLPVALEPAFEAALTTLHETRRRHEHIAPGRLSTRVIEQVMVACASSKAPELERLMPVLARYQVEAMRDESRARLDDLMIAPEPLVLPDFEAVDVELSVAEPLQLGAR